jgi:hypothetical protein
MSDQRARLEKSSQGKGSDKDPAHQDNLPLA